MDIRIIGLLIGYLLGCFQTAYIVGKFIRKIDIRKFGSGNSGTTNAIRVLGWKLGAVTFFTDIFKAIIAVVIVKIIFDEPVYAYYAGLGVILGHVWPVFLKFKGGKGIASSIGVMLALEPILGLIMMVIMALAVILSKYVSLGSILMVIAIPFYLLLFRLNDTDGLELFVVGSMITIITLYKHMPNIKRLITGKETKIGHKKEVTVEVESTIET
ncbi:MAG: glycerol-3-phosphate 1-O-acyltransferase PlsY [Vallitaleaceae bacterium]|jgi:glycerol-3-phosphate acyltransferase PlsY|nr:glycerol-3-phosphate 1-O-acyltransferase PlsY [Vallitaleaceae bacterium]